VPVLNFGAEIWGATPFEQAEKLQLEAGKTLLGVSWRTTNEAVRGELGWWSTRSQRDLKMLVFWARIVRMDDSRLAKIIYKQRRAKIKRVNDWCAQVKKTLISLKLEHVWESELVGEMKAWKRLVKSCLQQREEDEWREQMRKKPKLRLYRTLKFELKREEYLIMY